MEKAEETGEWGAVVRPVYGPPRRGAYRPVGSTGFPAKRASAHPGVRYANMRGDDLHGYTFDCLVRTGADNSWVIVGAEVRQKPTASPTYYRHLVGVKLDPSDPIWPTEDPGTPENALAHKWSNLKSTKALAFVVEDALRKVLPEIAGEIGIWLEKRLARENGEDQEEDTLA